MTTLFDRLRGRKEPSSAAIAKERLQLVLVTDRSNLSPEKLHEMQAEIIAVIKRYIPIDEMQVQISIEQRERKHYLVADIPLSRSPDYGAVEYAGPQSGEATAIAAQMGAEPEAADAVEPSAEHTVPDPVPPAQPPEEQGLEPEDD